jgi:tetratricopeptide (TPR) repeat protein
MESDLNNALISAEKDWRNRAKRLKKTYKRLKPQKWTSRRMAAFYGIGLAVVFVGYFGAKVAMFDPLTAMELEPESLFSQVEKPAAKLSDEQFALKTEQMDVIVMRDTPIWKQIQARIRSGDRRVEDLDRVASELIPNALLAAKKYRESGNFHAAINFENWVLDMYSVLAQPDAAEYVATYMLQGKDYLSLNQYGKAYRAFRNAYDRASKTLNSDARRDTIMQLNFALMRLAVHERNFEEALRHAGEISEGFFERAKWRDYHPNYQDIFAFQSELADIERLNNMPGSVGDFKRAIKNWENFIKSSRSNDQYDWQEYLAKSRYGLGLAEAQQKDFQSARENLETAYEFFRLRGKDPALTERVRKNYLLILRKTNPFEYLLKSLRS